MKRFSNTSIERTHRAAVRMRQHLRAVLWGGSLIMAIQLGFAAPVHAQKPTPGNAKADRKAANADSQTLSETGESKTLESHPPGIAASYPKGKTRSVHVQKAVVRSGPSEKYYATSELTQGASVDVYLETKDGWSGIRPPAGSHNWIPSDVAYLLPGGKIAEVVESNVPAWVGSETEQPKDLMWQLQVQQTQQLKILGEAYQSIDGGERKLWYRVAPPQGEFRWIRTSQISDDIASTKSAQAVASTNVPANAKQVRIDSAVQQAGHLQTVDSSASGPQVWSDEKQQLAEVERQIRAEQGEIERNARGQGINVALGDPEIQVSELPNREDGVVSTQLTDLADENGAPKKLVKNGTRVVGTSSRLVRDSGNNGAPQAQAATANGGGRRIVPTGIPFLGMVQSGGSGTANTNVAESTPSAVPAPIAEREPSKFDVSPLSGFLGMVGIGVIEANRKESIGNSFGGSPPGTLTSQSSVLGSGLADHLPRPSRRRALGSYAAGSPNPPGLMGDLSANTNMPTNTPARSPGETFSRWLNSQDPVFAGKGTQVAYGPSTGSTTNASYGSVANTAGNWHGLQDAPQDSIPHLAATPVDDSEEEVSEFATPEIQSALVELGRIISEPTETWDLTRLRGQATHWVESGSNALVRGEARLLLERVDRFQNLQRRSIAMQPSSIGNRGVVQTASASMNQPAPVATASYTTPVAPANTTPIGSSIADSQGDASGWLVQVHTSYPGQPEFALTDDAGNVVTYVQSTASLNLRRYLQQPVRIIGIRGYLPSLAAKQIVAERVVRIR